MLKLKLPFPISANRYWQIVGKRLIKTKQARVFISDVVFCWMNEKAKGAKSFKEDDYLALSIAVFYPVKRGPDVDLDNLCKVLIDAMETAQIFPNDKQVNKNNNIFLAFKLFESLLIRNLFRWKYFRCFKI